MNCNRFQKDILLNSSGELSQKGQQTLSKHLADCDSCRNYRDQMLTDVKAMGDLLPSGEPSSTVMAHIRERAQEATEEPRAILFPKPFMPALAAVAACLVIIGGIWIAMRPAISYERIDELGEILSMTSSEEWEATNVNGPDVSDLAEQLLEMEGFGDDSFIDLQLEDWMPAPTALQLRNTHAIPSKICG